MQTLFHGKQLSKTFGILDNKDYLTLIFKFRQIVFQLLEIISMIISQFGKAFENKKTWDSKAGK